MTNHTHGSPELDADAAKLLAMGADPGPTIDELFGEAAASASEAAAIKPGDIFRWAYRDPGDDRSYGRYHCCSRIAVSPHGGWLYDTYWSRTGGDPSFGPDDWPRLELTYLGNFADLENVGEWMADYYDAADIVNLNHPNSSRGNFYIRKGAKRSAAKMLETARYKLERAQSDEQTAARRAAEFREAIAKIEAGEIDDVHL